MDKTLFESIQRLMGQGWKSLRELTPQARFWILVVNVVFLNMLAIYQWYDRESTQEFVIYAGTAGSHINFVAQKLADKLRTHPNVYGRHYRIRIEQIAGLEGIEERVRNDESGRVIGFAADGKSDESKVRALFPLELSHLHVVVGPRLLNGAGALKPHEEGSTTAVQYSAARPIEDQPSPSAKAESNSAQSASPLALASIELDQASQSFKAGRVYLGPLHSDTRRIATAVLQTCHVSVAGCDKLAAHGISDWWEIRSALNSEDIDAAFFMAPLGADVIREIAEDGKCRLVDLNGIYDKLQEDESNPELKTHKIPEHIYPTPRYDDATSPPTPHYPFAPKDVETLSARRLIVANESMSPYDAFHVAKAARELMESVWVKGKKEGNVAMTWHKGATLVNDEKPSPPGSILATRPSWLLASLLPILVVALPGLLDYVTKMIGSIGAAKSTADRP